MENTLPIIFVSEVNEYESPNSDHYNVFTEHELYKSCYVGGK